jgi:hypothetical protein
MPKMKNILPHMRNNKVRVNGNSYKLNNEGEAFIEDEIAIGILLQDSAWRKVIDRIPIKSPLEDGIDYSKMHKDELIALLNYKNIEFDPKAKKAELIQLVQQLPLGE